MALHRDIFWIGRQWAVTGFGMQIINQKLGGQFDVEIARLWDDGWLDVLRAQPWLIAEDFAKGLAVARARFPGVAKAVPPPPVAALLQANAVTTPEPKPILEPIAPKLAEPTRPAAPPAPVIEPVVVAAVEPAKPTPSFLQMNIAEHSAKLLPMWRVQRRQ